MTLHSLELQSRIYKLIEYELEEALEAICFNPFHFQMKSRAFRLVSKFLPKVQCKEALDLMSLHPTHTLPPVFASHYTCMAMHVIFRQLSSIK